MLHFPVLTPQGADRDMVVDVFPSSSLGGNLFYWLLVCLPLSIEIPP